MNGQLALALPSNNTDLTALIERAASTLAGAQTAAEVLKAADMASVVYDVARRSARRAELQGAVDDIGKRVRKAQGFALEIESQAKRMFAERYTEAQIRGEVAGAHDGVRSSPERPSTADIGVTRKLIFEGREIAKAEKADPGVVHKVVTDLIEQGEEPTRAKLRAAVKKAIPPKPEAGSDRQAISLEQWKQLSTDERRAALSADDKDARLLKQTTTGIEWAQFSWNPVVGCLHTCPYCYARDIAERHKGKAFPHGFDPAFCPDRLSAPKNTKVPKEAKTDVRFKNVFTCSMADLFGRWTPAPWIDAVMQTIAANPQWNFLCLTKFPKRMAECEIPANAWMGTTVDLQVRVEAAEEAFSRISSSAGIRWLSIEPLIEPLKFKRLDLWQWMVIGGSSQSSKTPEFKPPFPWIASLVEQAREAGVRVYFKTNLLGNRMMEAPFDLPIPTDPLAAPRQFHYLGRKA